MFYIIKQEQYIYIKFLAGIIIFDMSEIKLLDKIRKDEQIINDLNDNLDSPNYKFSIGKYKVLTHIDSGNFGSVFKGFDT